MSLSEEYERESRICEEALDDKGYIVSIETGLTTTDGNVKKATSTYYEVYGVVTHDTKNKVTGTAVADKPVAIKKSGRAEVRITPKANRSTAIVIGSLLAVYDAGEAAEVTDCAVTTLLGTVNAANVLKAKKTIVGIALEAVAADADPTGNKIEVDLKTR